MKLVIVLLFFLFLTQLLTVEAKSKTYYVKHKKKKSGYIIETDDKAPENQGNSPKRRHSHRKKNTKKHYGKDYQAANFLANLVGAVGNLLGVDTVAPTPVPSPAQSPVSPEAPAPVSAPAPAPVPPGAPAQVSPGSQGPASPTTPGSPTAAPAPGGGGEVLTEINRLRGIHGAPPVTWDPSLQASALQSAKDICEKGNGQISHQYGGDNLWVHPTAEKWEIAEMDAVKLWYSEGSKFCQSGHYGQASPPDLLTYHFTALIWKGATTTGLAKHKCNGGQIVVAQNIMPQKNNPGEFAKNVGKPNDGSC